MSLVEKIILALPLALFVSVIVYVIYKLIRLIFKLRLSPEIKIKALQELEERSSLRMLSLKSNREAVDRVVKYLENDFTIDENFKNEIGRKEIEENFNFSYDYANRIFKKEFGDGIVKYRNKVRIDNAKFLLTSTQKSVDEICEDVGFSDKYYFTRYFTKCVGMSPICYRNR